MNLKEIFDQIEPKTDKGTSHSYIQNYYDEEFSPKQFDNIKILEIGIRQGYSHYLWDRFFINGEIFGVDNNESGLEYKEFLRNTRVKIYEDDAYGSFCSNFPDEYFDYIIDDGPHTIESQIKVLELWLPKIKKGGKLIIEDIQGKIFIPRILKAINTSLTENSKVYDFTSNAGKVDDILIEVTKK